MQRKKDPQCFRAWKSRKLDKIEGVDACGLEFRNEEWNPTCCLSDSPSMRAIAAQSPARSLVCAGGLLFLGLLDASFNFQNGIYTSSLSDSAMAIEINLVHCVEHFPSLS